MCYQKIRNSFYLLLVTGSIFGQNAEIKRFISPGYKMLDTLSGDLNLDGKRDMLLILKDDAEETSPTGEEQRPLLILLGQGDGSYYEAVRNNSVVMCKSCGGVMGDPYRAMVIKNGFFSVEHNGGSSEKWSDIATFKYDKKKKKWFLHKWGGDSWNANDPDHKVSTQVRTPKEFGIVQFENFRRE